MRIRILPLALVAALLVACDDTIGPTDPLTGTYIAEVFLVRPYAGIEVDVLALGGSMIVTIDDDNGDDNNVSGTLVMPPFLLGGALVTDLDGDARLVGSTVIFDLDEDSFVRDVTWTLTATGLVVINVTSDSAIYTVQLTRLRAVHFRRPSSTTFRQPVG